MSAPPGLQAILDCLREHGPQSAEQIAERTGLHYVYVCRSLRGRLAAQVTCREVPGRKGWRNLFAFREGAPAVVLRLEPAVRVPPPPPSNVRRLPTFARGAGERDETCANYSGCLSRFRAGGPGHCPTDCDARASRDLRAVDLARFAGARDRSAMSA